jgi:hypothetical protein
MLKQDIKFTDYNGNEREITEYFHLNEAEIVELQAKSVNGIQAEMQDAILSNDAGRVLDFIQMLVHKSYGKKSPDGINFDKSPEILHKFVTSAYYADFLLGLIEDNGAKGQEFVTGIMPAKLVERAMAQVRGQNGGEPDRTVYQPGAREVFAASRSTPEGVGTFGQPTPPQPPAEPIAVQQNDDMAEYHAWLAQKRAAESTTSTQAAPASPDAFRVREEDPNAGLPRPPHEQLG